MSKDADLLRRLADACEGTQSGEARHKLCQEARAQAAELDFDGRFIDLMMRTSTAEEDAETVADLNDAWHDHFLDRERNG